MMMPTAIDVLRKFGFEFSLDWDEEVKIEYPRSVDPKAVATWLGLNHHKDIRAQLKCRAAVARLQCVGGPLNGRRHGYCYGSVFAIRIVRARWAAYAVSMDGRAFFAGIGTSEKKARLLAIRSQASKEKPCAPPTT